MSKILNLEIIDIYEDVAVVETDDGIEAEIDLRMLPDNLKIGQSIKCVLSLNTNTVYRDIYDQKESAKLPNGKLLSY